MVVGVGGPRWLVAAPPLIARSLQIELMVGWRRTVFTVTPVEIVAMGMIVT